MRRQDRRTKKILLCVVIAFALAARVQGTTYYVKKTGNDNSNGTSWATAWATITKVNSVTLGGDTTYFGTGVWRGQLIPATGGTSSDRTCCACSSFVQGIAKIYGSVQMTGWIQHSGNVYKTKWTSPGGSFTTSPLYVLCQNDSMLHYVTSLASVNAAGTYYHDTSTDTIYAWCYGGGDPDNYIMEGSNRPVVFFNSRNQSYTTIWGLTLKYGGYSVIIIEADPKPNYLRIEHCNISRASSPAGENPASILFRSCTADTSRYGHYNAVRACSLGYSIDHASSPYHGSGVTVYSEHNLVVESCYVSPPFKVGLEKKNRGDGLICRNNVFRYNTIVGDAVNPAWDMCGIVAGWNHPVGDSIYGNIITGCTDGINVQAGVAPVGDSIFIANNTVYNPKTYGMEVADDGGNPTTPHKQFKYNLVSAPGSGVQLVFMQNSDTANFGAGRLDSNFYYAPSYTFNINWNAKTLTQWRNYGFDVHSTTGVNPGFADPANGDFSRPSLSQEMNLTYGGRTWTRYGAWQPGDEGGNHCPTSPTLNLPTDKDTISGVRPTLSLHNSSDPDPEDVLVYNFQVYSDSQLINLVDGVTNIAQGQSITSWQVTSDLPDESWFWWRARSFDGICYSDWSNKRKFYVKAEELLSGDLNRDGEIDAADISYLISYLFSGGPSPEPKWTGDINGDCQVNVADVIYLINYLFVSGPAPKRGCSS